MEITSYISTGILETYCLGLATPAETAEVESYAILYPEIRGEMGRINEALEEYAMKSGVEPDIIKKAKLLLSVYALESGMGKPYPPLIRKNTRAADFKEWIEGKAIPSPASDSDNLTFYDLPSTEAVINFMVWAREGHEEEVHTEYNEFIIILDGHCDMYFNGEKRHFVAGEIITIPPMVPHNAVITSSTPMIAIVQRQLIAA